VLDDVYQLIQKGKVYTEQEALVAAAPDMFPPDKFNSGVMVIRPSQSVFDNMMGQKALLTNYDGSDTGFLNAYYSEWHTEMAPLARLPFTWNAQRALYDMTYEKGHPNYWDLAISPDLHIIHYSGNPKPWEVAVSTKKSQDHDGATRTRICRGGDYLNDLWRQWYNRSKNFLTRYAKEKAQEKTLQETARIRQKQKEQLESSKRKGTPKDIHRLVSKRFKELRKEGYDAKTAMAMSRAEYGLEDGEPVSVGAQVASMFGIMM
jgi:glycogenin glucosyltransferase